METVWPKYGTEVMETHSSNIEGYRRSYTRSQWEALKDRLIKESQK